MFNSTQGNITTEQKPGTFDELMQWTINKNRATCEATILKQPYPNDGKLYCNATFDGYSCWNYTSAGSRAYGTCPEFFMFKFGQHKSLPFKDCNVDGSWYRHPDTNKPWSDYTGCTETQNVQRVHDILNIYIGGYSASIVALIIALCIFCSYRELKCSRVLIHKNMFVSYILAAALWVTYYASTTLHPIVLEENPVWCRFLHILAQYATSSNYAWMFCEGFYLHTILIITFVNEITLLRICCVVGWVVPAIQTLIYFGLRFTTPEIDKMCWHGQTNIQWIFLGPIAVLLLVNTFFLVNIVRTLCSKMKSMNQSDTFPVRRSLRATLILIPLLGVQYLAIPLRPVTNKDVTHVYNIISAVMVSFQGFFVSMLFCFFNGEVLFLLRTHFGIFIRRKSLRSDTVRHSFYSPVAKVNSQNRRKASNDCAIFDEGTVENTTPHGSEPEIKEEAVDICSSSVV